MIEMNKKYRYRSGAPARVLCVDRPVPNATVLAMSEKGVVTCHTADGVVWDQDHGFDLVEVSQWDDFEIDEQVMVRDRGDIRWYRRYFAGVRAEGVPQAWLDGATSWSANGSNPVPWDYCRRPTPEEMEGSDAAR